MIGARRRANRVDVQSGLEPRALDDRLARRREGADNVRAFDNRARRSRAFDFKIGKVKLHPSREPDDGRRIARPDQHPFDRPDLHNRVDMLDRQVSCADQAENAAVRPCKMPRGDGARRCGPDAGGDLPMNNRSTCPRRLRDQDQDRALHRELALSVVGDVREELHRREPLTIRQGRHHQEFRRARRERHGRWRGLRCGSPCDVAMGGFHRGYDV